MIATHQQLKQRNSGEVIAFCLDYAMLTAPRRALYPFRYMI